MCRSASDGDRYSGRTEPAEVSRGHGDGEAHFVALCAKVLCEGFIAFSWTTVEIQIRTEELIDRSLGLGFSFRAR